VEQGPAEWGETHGWFFGCEECQSCCPHNATAPLHTNPRFDALYDPRHYDSNFWAKVSRSEAESLFATTPLVRKFKKW
jgi:epoxyqueuosine reductase